MGIGKVLQDILYENKMNANELSDMINVPTSTIYSIIKRDNSKVDIDILLKICKGLNVDINRFYQEYLKDKKQDIYTNPEKEIIYQYRQLSARQQSAVMELLKSMTDTAALPSL